MKTLPLWLGALSAAIAVGVSCNSEETTPPTTNAATTSQGGAGGSVGAGGEAAGGSGGAMCEMCNCLANDAPEVDWVQLAQDPPAPLGGLIREGVYFLTEVHVYTGPTGMEGPYNKKWKLTMEFVGPPKGPVADVVLDQYDNMGEVRYSFAYQPDDNGAISFNSVNTPACMGAVNVPWEAYTYVQGDQDTPSVLTLYSTMTTLQYGFVFEQQSSPDGTSVGGSAGAP